ncbi:MAG: TIGR03915 family putative DNA repair protein [Dysgonamonadaceae bacterium]|jgi:probable DNA metabolism protein|nr:TIGR03915 family putative DNA repair protein [Dysgonamonadaceae bacterium]
MHYFIYDNTFDGLLTCVFDAFNRKEFPDYIAGESVRLPLFTESFRVITDEAKADRVLKALREKISKSALDMLFVDYLSESEGIEIILFRYIRKALTSEISIEMNFADSDVLELSKIYKKVTREEERMRQFVRFRKTADGIFFAVIDPLYNVLPLSARFFQNRFADQPWVIYDVRRKYGLYYDLKTVETVQFEHLNVSLETGNPDAEKLDDYELAFQDLWKDYLKAITIRERKNLKLQRQHMPKRFWKYLTETAML